MDEYLPRTFKTTVSLIGAREHLAELTYLTGLFAGVMPAYVDILSEPDTGADVSGFGEGVERLEPEDLLEELAENRFYFESIIPQMSIDNWHANQARIWGCTERNWSFRSSCHSLGELRTKRASVSAEASAPLRRLFSVQFELHTENGVPARLLRSLSKRFSSVVVTTQYDEATQYGNKPLRSANQEVIAYLDGEILHCAVGQTSVHPTALGQPWEQTELASRLSARQAEFNRVIEQELRRLHIHQSPDERLWNEDLASLNQKGPSELSAVLANYRRQGYDFEQFAKLLRTPSGFGPLDAVLATSFDDGVTDIDRSGDVSEQTALMRLDSNRVRELASLCAFDENLARFIEGAEGRLMNGLHVLPIMARIALRGSVETRGIQNILKYARLLLAGNLLESFMAPMSRPHTSGPRVIRKTHAPTDLYDSECEEHMNTMSIRTTMALVASGSPVVWRFLLDENKSGRLPHIDLNFIAWTAIKSVNDTKTFIDTFGVEPLGRLTGLGTRYRDDDVLPLVDTRRGQEMDAHVRAALARTAAIGEARSRCSETGEPVPWSERALTPEQVGPLDRRLRCGLTVAQAREMDSYDLFQLYKRMPSDQRDQLVDILDPMEAFGMYVEAETVYVTSEEMEEFCGHRDII